MLFARSTRKAHMACQRMKARQSQTLHKKGRRRETLKKPERENERKTEKRERRREREKEGERERKQT